MENTLNTRGRVIDINSVAEVAFVDDTAIRQGANAIVIPIGPDPGRCPANRVDTIQAVVVIRIDITVRAVRNAISGRGKPRDKT